MSSPTYHDLNDNNPEIKVTTVNDEVLSLNEPSTSGDSPSQLNVYKDSLAKDLYLKVKKLNEFSNENTLTSGLGVSSFTKLDYFDSDVELLKVPIDEKKPTRIGKRTDLRVKIPPVTHQEGGGPLFRSKYSIVPIPSNSDYLSPIVKDFPTGFTPPTSPDSDNSSSPKGSSLYLSENDNNSFDGKNNRSLTNSTLSLNYSQFESYSLNQLKNRKRSKRLQHGSKGDPNLISEQSFYNKDKNNLKLSGNSLLVFSPRSRIRRFCAFIVNNKLFSILINLLVFIDWLILISQWWDVGERDNIHPMAGHIKYRVILYLIFTVEILGKVITHGLIFTPKFTHLDKKLRRADTDVSKFISIFVPSEAYLRKSVHRIDFIAVTAFWLDFFLTNYADPKNLAILKALSSLRPLRLLTTIPRLAVIVTSLRKSLPLLSNLTFFLVYFFLMFGTAGLLMFSERLQTRCFLPDQITMSYPERHCRGSYDILKNVLDIVGKPKDHTINPKGFVCEYPLICKNIGNPEGGQLHFDNILSSTLMVYIISSMEKWTDIMYRVMQADSNVASIFFVIAVLILNYWLITLFVAVVARMFEKIREDDHNSAFALRTNKTQLKDCSHDLEELNLDESTLTTASTFLFKNSTSHLQVSSPTSTLVLKHGTDLSNGASSIIDVAEKPSYNTHFINFVVRNRSIINCCGTVLTLLDLFLRVYDVHTSMKSLPYVLYLIINILLVIQAALMVIGLFCDPEFKSMSIKQMEDTRWKRRGVIIWLILSAGSLLVVCLWPFVDGNVKAYLSFIPIIRFYRFPILIPRIKRLVLTLARKGSGIVNLLLFIMACMLVVAPVGMQLVGGRIPRYNPDDDYTFMRFDNFPLTLLTLFQVFSGEDWTDVLFDSMNAVTGSYLVQVIAIALVLWSAFSNFVLLNLFIAITMEAFETAEKLKHSRQVSNYVNQVTKAWNKMQKNPISKWNLYRFFAPNPKAVSVDELPRKLMMSVPLHLANQLMTTANHEDREDLTYSPNEPSSPHWWHPLNLFNRLTGLTSRSISPLNMNKDINLVNPMMERIAVNLNKPETHRSLDVPIAERDYMRIEFEHSHPLYNCSWFFFVPDHPIRKLCLSLTDPPINRDEKLVPVWRTRNFLFNLFIWGSIVVTVVLALINTPNYRFEMRKYDLDKLYTLRVVDYIMASIFLFEFLIRTIAHGFILTPKAYLKNMWYRVDFVVLVLYVVDISVPVKDSSHFSQALRALKALRALRLTSFSNKVKNSLYGVFVVGFPLILDVSILLISFILPYAFYGQLIFGGKLASCNDQNVTEFADCKGIFSNSNHIVTPRVWGNHDNFSFDDFHSALLILIEVLSGEKWVDVMTGLMSITGPGTQPEPEASWWNCLYPIFFYVVGTIIVLSIFVAVIIENYRVYTGISHLTADQRRWIDLHKQLSQIEPSFRPTVTYNPRSFFGKIKSWCFHRATEKKGWWSNILTFLYIVILLLLVTEYSGQGAYAVKIKNYLIIACLILVSLDLVFKVIGLGFLAYARRPWTLTHALINLAGLITTACSIAVPENVVINDFSNILALLVSFKLVTKSDSLAELSSIALASLPDILRTLYIWLILYLAYCIFFTQMFGLTRIGPNGSEFANFKSFENAMLLMFRMTTGEAWNDMMHDFTVEAPHCVLDPHDYLNSDCGNPFWAYLLFLSFNFLSMYIFTNMFVVVVMDNFNYCYEIAASFSLLNRKDIRHFKKVWSQFDRYGKGYIQTSDLVKFIRALQKPFRLRYFDSNYDIATLRTTWLAISGSNSNNDDFNYSVTKLSDGKEADKCTEFDYTGYFMWLNSKLDQLSLKNALRRKQKFNMFYFHALAHVEGAKGISITNILVLLVQYKIVNPDHCLRIDDLIAFRKKRVQVLETYRQEKALGFFRTLILRRKFVKHMKSRRNGGLFPSPFSAPLPEILVDGFNPPHDFDSNKLKPGHSRSSVRSLDLGPPQLVVPIHQLNQPQRLAGIASSTTPFSIPLSRKVSNNSTNSGYSAWLPNALPSVSISPTSPYMDTKGNLVDDNTAFNLMNSLESSPWHSLFHNEPSKK